MTDEVTKLRVELDKKDRVIDNLKYCIRGYRPCSSAVWSFMVMNDKLIQEVNELKRHYENQQETIMVLARENHELKKITEHLHG